MKKQVLAIALAAISAASLSAAVSIKLSGGFAYVGQSDYNAGMRGIYDYAAGQYTNMNGAYHAFHFGTDFGGEIIVSLGPSTGIGLEARVVREDVQNSFSYTSAPFQITEAYHPRLTAIPIALNLHQLVPLGGAWRLDVSGGIAYYWTTFDHDRTMTTDFFSYTETESFSSRTGVFGVQAGVGLEFAAGRHLAFLLQAEGRYAIAPYMTGDRTESVTWFQGDISQGPTSSASFWSYERVAGGTTYAAIAFSGAEPADPDVSSARKGRYDLSGFSLRAGIKFIL